MKTSDILVLLSLSVIVNGAWWAAVTQPVILGFGAAFAALDLDVPSLDILNMDWMEWARENPGLKRKEFRDKLKRKARVITRPDSMVLKGVNVDREKVTEEFLKK